MTILIHYKPPCNVHILSDYGTIEFVSKLMRIVVLDTIMPIEEIKKIDGVITASKERDGKLI